MVLMRRTKQGEMRTKKAMGLDPNAIELVEGNLP